MTSSLVAGLISVCSAGGCSACGGPHDLVADLLVLAAAVAHHAPPAAVELAEGSSSCCSACL